MSIPEWADKGAPKIFDLESFLIYKQSVGASRSGRLCTPPLRKEKTIEQPPQASAVDMGIAAGTSGAMETTKGVDPSPPRERRRRTATVYLCSAMGHVFVRLLGVRRGGQLLRLPFTIDIPTTTARRPVLLPSNSPSLRLVLQCVVPRLVLLVGSSVTAAWICSSAEVPDHPMRHRPVICVAAVVDSVCRPVIRRRGLLMVVLQGIGGAVWLRRCGSVVMVAETTGRVLGTISSIVTVVWALVWLLVRWWWDWGCRVVPAVSRWGAVGILRLRRRLPMRDGCVGLIRAAVAGGLTRLGGHRLWEDVLWGVARLMAMRRAQDDISSVDVFIHVNIGLVHQLDERYPLLRR